MANEDPAFSDMGSADAISAAAQAISGIRSDMAAIERHARGFSREMERGGQGGGGGVGATSSTTGTGTPAFTGSALGRITQAVGGPMVVAGGIVGGVGAIAGGGLAGAVAAAGFNDLRVGPQRGLNYERARFAYAQGTGNFDTFQRNLLNASNSINVQDEQVFQAQFGQLAGLYGLSPSMAGSNIYGGLSTLGMAAGLTQGATGSAYNTIYGSQAYYSSLAAGVSTRDAQGNMRDPSLIVNDLYRNLGLANMNQAQSLEQIRRGTQPGGMLRRQLEEMFQGDQNAVSMVIRGLQARAQSGRDISEGGFEEALRGAGLVGTDQTQGFESQLGFEQKRLEQTSIFADSVTAGVSSAMSTLTEAVEILNTDFRDLAMQLEEVLATLDTFQSELPTATNAVTGAFGGLASLLSTAGGSFLGSLLGGGGGKGVLGGVKNLFGKGGVARSVLGFVGKRLIPGVGAITLGGAGVNKVQEMAGVGGKDFGVGDWFGTIAAGAGIGAAAGTIVPGIGNIVGAIGGAIAGAIEAGIEESRDSAYENNKAEGDWNVNADQNARIHYGEMVVPKYIAQAVREEVALGQMSPGSSRSSQRTDVTINLTIQRATDQEAMYFASRVKKIIDNDDELIAIGSGRF